MQPAGGLKREVHISCLRGRGRGRGRVVVAVLVFVAQCLLPSSFVLLTATCLWSFGWLWMPMPVAAFATQSPFVPGSGSGGVAR